MLGVDGSQAQTEAILRRKALEHADQVERNIDPVQAAKIRDYMGAIPVTQFTDHPNNRIVNPASKNIIEQRPVPTNFAEARFDGDKLLGYIETVTLIQHPKRFTVDTGKGLKMLTVPADVWYTMKILGNNMVMSSLGLTDEDQAVLRFLRESKAACTKRDIQQGLRQAGYTIRTKDVAQSLESMMEAMYVTEQQNGTDANTYTLSEFAQVTTHNVGLDYGEVAKAAAEEVYNTPGVPTEVADAYVGRFCEGDGLLAIDPYTGTEVDITEDDSLQKQVDAATEEVADIFDDDPFWGDDEGENEATDELEEVDAETQGTLA
jgi:Fe2+ or Zn2+ uptake regulation protein